MIIKKIATLSAISLLALNTFSYAMEEEKLKSEPATQWEVVNTGYKPHLLAQLGMTKNYVAVQESVDLKKESPIEVYAIDSGKQVQEINNIYGFVPYTKLYEGVGENMLIVGSHKDGQVSTCYLGLPTKLINLYKVDNTRFVYPKFVTKNGDIVTFAYKNRWCMGVYRRLQIKYEPYSYQALMNMSIYPTQKDNQFVTFDLQKDVSNTITLWNTKKNTHLWQNKINNTFPNVFLTTAKYACYIDTYGGNNVARLLVYYMNSGKLARSIKGTEESPFSNAKALENEIIALSYGDAPYTELFSLETGKPLKKIEVCKTFYAGFTNSAIGTLPGKLFLVINDKLTTYSDSDYKEINKQKESAPASTIQQVGQDHLVVSGIYESDPNSKKVVQVWCPEKHQLLLNQEMQNSTSPNIPNIVRNSYGGAIAYFNKEGMLTIAHAPQKEKN